LQAFLRGEAGKFGRRGKEICPFVSKQGSGTAIWLKPWKKIIDVSGLVRSPVKRKVSSFIATVFRKKNLPACIHELSVFPYSDDVLAFTEKTGG